MRWTSSDCIVIRMNNKHHVLVEKMALRLGVVDAAGNRLAHDASHQDIAAAAESSHETLDAAYAAAHAERSDGHDRWIVDGSGDTHYVAGGK